MIDSISRRSRHGRLKNMHGARGFVSARPASLIGSAQSKKMALGHLHVDSVSISGLSTTAFPWVKNGEQSKEILV